MLSYVTALPSAKMEYLFQALSRAVRYFGGVAEVSKTDNMRQWIKKTDRYEPTLNEADRQWCLHNGTELDECRSARPLDKGPAESLVNQTYRYYYSRICRDTFFSYDDLNSRLDELNDMFNDRPRKNKTYSDMSEANTAFHWVGRQLPSRCRVGMIYSALPAAAGV